MSDYEYSMIRLDAIYNLNYNLNHIFSPEACTDPGVVTNATISGDTTFNYYTSLKYSCSSGNYLNGSETLYCEHTGNWNASLPTCIYGKRLSRDNVYQYFGNDYHTIR